LPGLLAPCKFRPVYLTMNLERCCIQQPTQLTSAT